MYPLSQQILRTDVAGMPLEWIGFRDAARVYHLGQVAYSCGIRLYTVHGGVNAVTGLRSKIEINSIIATQGDNRATHKARQKYKPPLSNQALFARDARVCMYCGDRFPTSHLSRDHIQPLSQGGADTWQNVVAACKRCNNFKAGRTPEQAGLELLAVPFVPNHAEYVYLQGRRVLADQMEFLLAHFPRTSPLHQRINDLIGGASVDDL